MNTTASDEKPKTTVQLPRDAINPITVEVTRGPIVESRHRGAAAVVDAAGRLAAAWGDIDLPVYPRSAVKPMQAIPLVESGATDAFGLENKEIALACASHGGEAVHVETVSSWLARLGLDAAALECGSHWPSNDAAARALAAAGATPSALHNNCSGKHTGFLSVARHLGWNTGGYVHFEHPVQQYLLETMESLCGIKLRESPRGIDGCAIPTYAIPLRHLASGMARMAAPDALPAARAKAIRRILAAMAAEPFMVAGSGRYCTRILHRVGAKLMIKAGAEGILCAALPERGLGIALKCDDGATRAAETMMTALLIRFGGWEPALRERLEEELRTPVLNRNGLQVGEIRPSAQF